ncbi:TRAP transporter small permease [Xenophilus azovorans]|uniref:TRAP transporter small permease n=1 Tax=Xenophilus azovorans TaxID=151755 RepID=UPI00056E46B5|nr:TRAP transporter small permease subunit [Xenophilus azovorans]
MLASFEKGLSAIDWLLSRLAALLVLAVMLMIACDVGGRYFFSHPLPWVYDVVSIYVINIVVYFMVSEVLRTQTHIELDLQVRFLPPRAWGVLQAVAWVAAAAVLVLTTWVVGQSMAESFGKGEVHPGLYEWPVWIEKATITLGLGLLTLRILARLARYLQRGQDASVFNKDESAAESATAGVH